MIKYPNPIHFNDAVQMLRTNELSFDAESSLLVPGRKFEGHGLVEIGDAGRLRLLQFGRTENAVEHAFLKIQTMPAGTMPPPLGRALITDCRGTKWQCAELNNALVNAGQCRVETTLPYITTVKKNREVENAARLFFSGSLDVVTHVPTTRFVKVGNNQPTLDHQKTDRAWFDALDIQFELIHHSDGVELLAWTGKPLISCDLIESILTAFQFVHDAITPPSVLQMVRQRTSRMCLTGRMECNQALKPPIQLRQEFACNVWTMFRHMLEFVVGKPDRRGRIREIVGDFINGQFSPLQADALATSVAIEGLVDYLFADLVEPGEDFVKDVKQLESYVKRTYPKDSQLSKRFGGTLAGMRTARVKDRLMELVSRGLIEEDLFAAWNKVRNKAAHSKLYSFSEQDLLTACGKMAVLFYHVIFLATGYTGMYTNYGELGWPPKPFDKTILPADMKNDAE